MGSRRLPGKALAPLLGKPMLEVILERLAPTRRIQQIGIATSESPHDDAIQQLARRLSVPCFRGSEEDCLDRFYRAAASWQADVVVRLTGDNLLVDAEFVDGAIDSFFSGEPKCDYLSSALSKTFPTGLSVEVFTFAALAEAWQSSSRPEQREHITLYLYEHPERFCIRKFASSQDLSHLRWTVDTPEDLAVVQRIFESIGSIRFSWREAVALAGARKP